MATVPILEDLASSSPLTIDRVGSPVDLGEVMRYLGYPSDTTPGRVVGGEIEKWVEHAALLAQPRATYSVYPVVGKSNQSLTLGTPEGTSTFHGAIGEFLLAAEYIALFIATAGPKIDGLAGDLMKRGDELAAMVVNAVGAERAEAAESEVIHRLQSSCRPIGYAPTLPYSPGYCGMKLTEQRTLFSLFRGVDTGVALTDACLMRPVKSISGLIGLGPEERVASYGSPCDRCELYQCAMRR